MLGAVGVTSPYQKKKKKKIEKGNIQELEIF